MSGTRPIFHKDPSLGSDLQRTTNDGNSFADVNKLQEQIGDLNTVETDIGDSRNDIDSDENLVSFINDLKAKIFGQSNDPYVTGPDQFRKGKAIQRDSSGSDYELLPAGMVIVIAGTATNEEGGDVAGLDTCPSGYVELSNQDLINSLNSIFFGDGTDRYSPDYRGFATRYADTGDNDSGLYNISIGNISSDNDHIHDMTHNHNFPHGEGEGGLPWDEDSESSHFHFHNAIHFHDFSHSHQMEDHSHSIPKHDHRVKGYTSDGALNTIPRSQSPLGVFIDTDDDTAHMHKFEDTSDKSLSDTGGIISGDEITSLENQRISDVEPLPNNSGSWKIVSWSTDSNETTGGNKTSDSLETDTEVSAPLPRSKKVKFCMKV